MLAFIVVKTKKDERVSIVVVVVLEDSVQCGEDDVDSHGLGFEARAYG